MPIDPILHSDYYWQLAINIKSKAQISFEYTGMVHKYMQIVMIECNLIDENFHILKKIRAGYYADEKEGSMSEDK